ncbi:hypothetical protein H4582DRAFT_340280 [Lactarius indigo]|nr:hypothetical protein H4582DRAFT_340280 [Lactarius indigo]
MSSVSTQLFQAIRQIETTTFSKWFTGSRREMSVRPDSSRPAATATQKCAAPPFEQDGDLSYARRLQSEFDSEECALRLQNEFDIEDRALSAERIRLFQTVQQVFECGICMEKMPEDSVARPDPCGHAFCRDCMRGYVSTCLEEHKFPILCPTCTAGKGKGMPEGVTGEVSQTLAQDLGLTDKQFDIWIELEMTPFSVLLHCRKCQRSVFVARDEHEGAKIIECPLSDCNYVWCKQCQQAIHSGGPNHSCDGTSELDHLVKQQGWKYCPSCKTPIQKESGCNHMTCMTPACNTHFCYLCGDLIIKSALRQEIHEAVSSHFRAELCALRGRRVSHRRSKCQQCVSSSKRLGFSYNIPSLLRRVLRLFTTE